MTPEELINVAIAKGPVGPGARRAAEGTLKGAGIDLAAADAAVARLMALQGSVTERLASVGRDFEKVKPALAKEVLEAISDPAIHRRVDVRQSVQDAAEKRRLLADEQAVIALALDHVSTHELPIAIVRKLEAQIVLTQARRAWVEAAAHLDLFDVMTKLGVLLGSDAEIKVDLSKGKATAYCLKLNELDEQVVQLRDELKKAQAFAQKEMK